MERGGIYWVDLLEAWLKKYPEDPAIDGILIANVEQYMRDSEVALTDAELDTLLNVLENAYADYPDTVDYVRGTIEERTQVSDSIHSMIKMIAESSVDLDVAVAYVDNLLKEVVQLKFLAGSLTAERAQSLLTGGSLVAFPQTREFVEGVTKVE